ncbi:LytTR family transcriptional regulator DNA-binding domain-containing protein [Nitrospirillum iridis]|uniref:HTH LytTR-type domain-containing protein n=1 Tax=Nitrospirillum iridis TaxID=765888 RepID=A0A7X0B1Z4_9PROT|nr:LytTR family transcriptional regulator DNA-binding domain-containing protein [Nitrospirillum iridis]MBB6254243.1 hypothetical protein [Nitrospirillum iridis]
MLGDSRSWARAFVAATAAGVILGLVGPFGSFYNESLPVLVAYWVVALWLGTGLLGVTLRLALARANGWSLPRALGLVTVMSALSALPLAVVCRVVALALWPGPIARIGWSLWYGQTLLMSLCCALAYGVLGGYLRRAPVPPALVLDPGQPLKAPASGSFLDRLPPALGRDLIALQMEDHYVRAHTLVGSALVLTPLHQAIAELGAVPGLKVHRSWWVARAAVAGAVRDGRNLRLRLTTGLEAPVARANVAAVRAAGWLVGVD